jgi:hypothetical protein
VPPHIADIDHDELPIGFRRRLDGRHAQLALHVLDFDLGLIDGFRLINRDSVEHRCSLTDPRYLPVVGHRGSSDSLERL